MAKQVFVHRKRKRRGLKIVAAVFATLLFIAALLEAGVFVEHLSPVWTPDYQKQDISALLYKKERTQQDYTLLYQQTGLSAAAIDELIYSGNAQSVLDIQNDFFAPRERITTQFAPFTCCHTIDTNIKTAPLKAGDIIVSPTTHFSIFRLGHASLLTDPQSGDMASAIGYMSESFIENISEITDRTSFIILRARDGEKAAAAAEYAEQNLLGLPYSISVGLTSKKFPDTPDRTHCSHLVWYAYKAQGMDIDENGGPFVFPSDILFCSELEIVQVYGIDPQEVVK